ncbi:MAG: tRNA pseudouridine(13) synthase TruD [Phycisphaerales bacterium]|jgi:tRNA pseudouridine13 synthase|nr:tRNA pseudouridine(13) synthase TruD [Phycisphaerales bacterium]
MTSSGDVGAAARDSRGLDSSPHVRPTRYLTADVPGIGGVIKQRDDDFLVEEIPAYQPCGSGEHIYIFVQKRGLSTQQLVKILAKHFGVRESAIGYAGLKDRHAITRQVISIHAPGKTPEDFPMITDERIVVLWSDLHSNKLRRGHLLGNRFSIRVRNVTLRSVFDAQKTLQRLEARGVPNRTGEQRFGLLEDNHLVGRALVLGQWREALDLILGPSPHACLGEENTLAREAYARGDLPEALRHTHRTLHTEQRLLRALIRGAGPLEACKAIEPLARGFYFSALQSAVFNRVLDERLEAGTFDRLLPGDLAFKHEGGAVFSVEDAADVTLAQRLAKGEISPSGPMWGPRMARAGGQVDHAELAALAAFGLTPEQLDGPLTDADIPGTRRSLRVPITHVDLEAGGDEHGTFVRVAFDLPAGAFATVVMEEVMKVGKSGIGDQGIEG